MVAALLATAACGALTGCNGLDRRGQSKVKVDIANVETCLKMFQVDCGRFPTTAEGLRALVEKPGDLQGWNGPYLDKVPVDPWGTEYQYRCPGQHNTTGFDVWSFGPDQKDGGGDDFDNWSKK